MCLKNVSYHISQKIITSQNHTVKYDIGDDPDIIQAKVKCAAKPLKGTVDESTFHPAFYKDEFAIYTHYIVNVFKQVHECTYAELLNHLRHAKLDEDILKFALDNMINSRIVFENNKAVKGFIVQYGNKYMFQPFFAPKSRISIKDRKDFEPKQVKHIKFDDSFKGQKQVMKEGEIIESLDKEIKNIEKNTLLNSEEYCKRLKKYIVDYVVDRMTFEKQLQLCEEIIGDAFESNMYIKSLIADDRIVIANANTYYIINIFNTGEKMHIIKDGKISECNPLEIGLYKSMTKPFKEQEDKILKSFKGFMTLKGTFKIFSDQGGASGTVCGTGDKVSQEKYMEMINAYDENLLGLFVNQTKGPIKAIKCNLYELLLRANTPRIFARPHYASRCKQK